MHCDQCVAVSEMASPGLYTKGAGRCHQENVGLWDCALISKSMAELTALFCKISKYLVKYAYMYV